MPTLGEELRHRREERGISLAEISEATRIGTRFLKAIETDNFSILPGGIFTRSFIRAYAKHVGMNEDEAIAMYLQQASGATSDQGGPSPAATAERNPPEESTKRTAAPKPVPPKPAPERSHRSEPVTYRQATSRTSWPTIVIGAGILVFVGIIVVALVKQLNQGAGQSESQSASAPKSEAAKPSAPQGSQPSGQTASPPAASPQPTSDGLSGQPLVVKIEAATGDVWVKYQVDEAKPTILLLKQGQSQDLPPAQTQVTLNYGNRLTLKLKINNRDATFPPDTPKFASQVVISRENFQTYLQ